MHTVHAPRYGTDRSLAPSHCPRNEMLGTSVSFAPEFRVKFEPLPDHSSTAQQPGSETHSPRRVQQRLPVHATEFHLIRDVDDQNLSTWL
jgi:hypothetical protein